MYIQLMYERAVVQKLQSDWRTESFGRTDLSHQISNAAHCIPIVRGLWLPAKEDSKLLTNLEEEKTCKIFCPIT